jgi:hypothetical protein
MHTELIAEKIKLGKDTLHAIMDGMASEPALCGRSTEELHDLLFEVLGVLTGDSPRSEFPRTEADRVVFGIARAHLEPQEPNELSRRLAWLSLWLSVRQFTAAA